MKRALQNRLLSAQKTATQAKYHPIEVQDVLPEVDIYWDSVQIRRPTANTDASCVNAPPESVDLPSKRTGALRSVRKKNGEKSWVCSFPITTDNPRSRIGTGNIIAQKSYTRSALGRCTCGAAEGITSVCGNISERTGTPGKSGRCGHVLFQTRFQS